MPIKLLRPEDVIIGGKARFGWYGSNGAGKTTLLSTVDPSIPTLAVNASGEGLKPLRGLPHFWVVTLEKWADLGEIFELVSTTGMPDNLKAMLRASMEADPRRRDVVAKRIADPSFKNGTEPFFGAVGFDTWTRIQALALAHITGQEMPAPGEEAEFITKAPKLPKGYDAWQSIGSLSGEWMRYFNRLNIHCMYLFQEQTRVPKFENDVLETAPALTPTALYAVKDTLELLGRLYVEEVSADKGDLLADKDPTMRGINLEVKEQRILFIGKHPRYFAKGPSHLLGRAVKDPTWAKLAASLEIQTVVSRAHLFGDPSNEGEE